MATSLIHNLGITKEIKNAQINWFSTSNPTCDLDVDISKSGYIPIALGFQAKGTQSSYIMVMRLYIDGNTAKVSCRMINQNPSTTTQNTIDIHVTYAKL